MHAPPLPRLAAALVTAATLAACGGRDTPATTTADAGGTIVITSPGDADVLLPPLTASLQGAQVVSQIFDRLAEIGDSLGTVGDDGFAPRLATRWEWAPDSLSIRFTLDERARWHDGRRVRAEDVRFSFDVAHDPATGTSVTQLLANVDSVTAPDSLTAVAYFRRRSPQQFFDLTYNLFVLPRHLLDSVPRSQLRTAAFGKAPVGSGRFRFVRWVPNERIELIADTANWRGRPKLDRVIWAFAPDPTAATNKLFAGEADVLEVLRGPMLDRVKTAESLRAVEYPSLSIGYLGFNTAQAPFDDRALRRALAAAVDRQSLVTNVFDTLGYVAVMPVPRVFGASRPSAAFDPSAASRSLDSLGWRMGPDSVRTRGGRRLAFSVLVPGTSAPRQRLAVLLQAQWKRVGVDLTVDVVEMGTFMQRLAQHQYDTFLNAWQGDPEPSTIRQTWSSRTADRGPTGNTTGYASATFDAYLDSATVEFDRARRHALFERAYATLVDDAPAVYIYELRNFAGLHRRIRPVGLRADAWWANLSEWSIPPSERIDRDRIGLRTAVR